MNETNKDSISSIKNYRTETEAYKANSEVMQKLYTEESFFYKPWQFVEYSICAATLKTTYEEVNIWGKQAAMIRPGWKVENGVVYIPNIFAKINGVHKNLRLYRKEIKFLKNQPNILFYMGFPMYIPRKNRVFSKEYFSVLNKEGYIDKNKLMNSHFWKYRHLKNGLQNCIADRIIDFCTLSRFKNYENIFKDSKASFVDGVLGFLKTFDIHINLSNSSDEMAKMKVFEILNNLEDSLIRMIVQFDYPSLVPKIIIYNNGNRFSKVTFDDAVKLMFMNSMGIDIIIHNPAGYNDIEDFIKEQYFDIHNLEDVYFNLRYNKWIFF